MIQLNENEEYDMGEQLDALMQFVSEQAVITQGLIKSYPEIAKRLDECGKTE